MTIQLINVRDLPDSIAKIFKEGNVQPFSMHTPYGMHSSYFTDEFGNYYGTRYEGNGINLSDLYIMPQTNEQADRKRTELFIKQAREAIANGESLHLCFPGPSDDFAPPPPRPEPSPCKRLLAYIIDQDLRLEDYYELEDQLGYLFDVSIREAGQQWLDRITLKHGRTSLLTMCNMPKVTNDMQTLLLCVISWEKGIDNHDTLQSYLNEYFTIKVKTT